MYPVKSLKKYKTSDMMAFEPVLTLADMTASDPIETVHFVGGNTQSTIPTTIPTTASLMEVYGWMVHSV